MPTEKPTQSVKAIHYIALVIFGICILLPTLLAFRSRIQTGEGGTPLVKDANKIAIVGAAGDSYTVSSIRFVDKDSKAIIVINAGPPPTIEITDDKGKVKTVDLRKLASRVSIFGELNE